MKEKIFETDFWLIKLNSNDQHNLGRSVVVLKRECHHLSEITKEEILDLYKIIKKLESALKNAFGATMFNWTCLMNNAYKKDNDEKPQVHLHFRPRYENKVEFEGKIFEDTDFAHHYKNGTKRIVSEDLAEKIIEKIVEELNKK